MIMPRSGHDQATIVPRSGHDRGPGHTSHAVQSSGSDSTLKEQRSQLDRAAIVEFFHMSSLPSDLNLTLQISSEKRRKSDVAWPLDRDRAV